MNDKKFNSEMKKLKNDIDNLMTLSGKLFKELKKRIG